MTDEEERAKDARLEAAAARAPPHSVHRLVRHFKLVSGIHASHLSSTNI